MHPEFLNNDAFSLETLTKSINDIPSIPGRASELVFAGIGEGVATTKVDIEIDPETLELIPFTTRGAPDHTSGRDKRQLVSFEVPHVSLTEGIAADSMQNVREVGAASALVSARSVVDRQMRKQARRHDLTLESIRLGALSGVVKDKNGVVAANLFDVFGVTEVVIDFDDTFITAEQSEQTLLNLQGKLFHLVLAMRKALRGPWISTAKVWCLAGEVFFRKLVATIGGGAVRGSRADAKISLGDSYAMGVLEFGGVFFEPYLGTDDGTAISGGMVGVPPNEARFFIVGYSGLYAEYFAPADFVETANTIGVPRYAKVVPMDNLGRGLTLHTQQNPLPLCLKPKTLFRGTCTASTEDVDFYVDI